jgi:hypothetical protein
MHTTTPPTSFAEPQERATQSAVFLGSGRHKELDIKALLLANGFTFQVKADFATGIPGNH